MSAVWDHSCETHTQKLVLLALADNANDEGKCWPSIATIARKCQLAERSVYRQLSRLGELNLLKYSSGGGNKSNRYTLRLTPDTKSGVQTVHPCQPVRGGVTQCQGSPDRESEEPSGNHKLTVRGEGKKSPPLFSREYKDLIEDAEKEIEAIKARGILSDIDREEIKAFRAKIADWKRKRFALC